MEVPLAPLGPTRVVVSADPGLLGRLEARVLALASLAALGFAFGALGAIAGGLLRQ